MENLDNLNREESINRIKSFINKIEVLNEEEWSETLSYIKFKKIEKGQFFSKQGEVANEIGFILKGLFRTYYTDNLGEETTTSFQIEDNLISSYISFINRIPANQSIKALDDAYLIVISYSDIQILFNKYWKWQRISRIIHVNNFALVSTQLLIITTLEALDRYLVLRKYMPSVVERAPLKYIASYLNMAPETLSRVRNKCKNNNIELSEDVRNFINNYHIVK